MWDKMLAHWNDWSHPLRPNSEDILNYSLSLFEYRTRLLLGATPELIPLSTDQVDKVSNGIDWFNLPYPKESFDAIFGDNSMGASGPELLNAVFPFLRPGGVFVTRQFLLNNSKKHTDNFLIKKFQGWNKTFLPVQEIYDKYGDTPTTRDYNGSKDVYYFPTLEQLWNLRPYKEIIYPSYDFGEFFPIIVWKA